MDNNDLRTRLNRQKKYRQKQTAKGLARFEIQIPTETKAKFDELVEAIAEEYIEPYDKRRRIALARAQVFDELTRGITHEFFELKDQIAALKDEIRALSPNFFKIKTNNKTPLPEAISALPDDPKKLKQLMSKLYCGLQAANIKANEQKRRAEQFEDLYEVASNYNETLQTKLALENEELH